MHEFCGYNCVFLHLLLKIDINILALSLASNIIYWKWMVYTAVCHHQFSLALCQFSMCQTDICNTHSNYFRVFFLFQNIFIMYLIPIGMRMLLLIHASIYHSLSQLIFCQDAICITNTFAKLGYKKSYAELGQWVKLKDIWIYINTYNHFIDISLKLKGRKMTG